MSGSERKYPGWGEFLKRKRFERFRSAREFCSRENVGISYPQYSRYEAGDQLPNLDQAIRICELLQIPVLEGILEWCLAQISSDRAHESLSNYLKQVRKGGSGIGQELLSKPSDVKAAPKIGGEVKPGMFDHSSISLNDVIVFNRSHLKLFQSDPIYRDIFTYVNSYAPDWVSSTELSRAIGVPVDRVESMVEDLSDVGVLLVAGGKCRTSKKTFYFPDDQDFFDLRNQNFIFNSQSVLKRLSHKKLTSRGGFRGVVTRELTTDQVDQLIAGIEKVVDQMIRMPETNEPDRIYSLCLLLGERFSRSEATGMEKTEVPEVKPEGPSPTIS